MLVSIDPEPSCARCSGIVKISAPEGPATEIYKNYVPSKAVWNVTMVKVVPNRIDDYLGGLKQSWVSGCEINKKMGVLKAG